MELIINKEAMHDTLSIFIEVQRVTFSSFLCRLHKHTHIFSLLSIFTWFLYIIERNLSMDSKAMTCKTIYSAVLSISFSRVFILFIFPNYFIFMKMKDRRDNKTINQVRNCCWSCWHIYTEIWWRKEIIDLKSYCQKREGWPRRGEFDGFN